MPCSGPLTSLADLQASELCHHTSSDKEEGWLKQVLVYARRLVQVTSVFFHVMACRRRIKCFLGFVTAVLHVTKDPPVAWRASARPRRRLCPAVTGALPVPALAIAFPRCLAEYLQTRHAASSSLLAVISPLPQLLLTVDSVPFLGRIHRSKTNVNSWRLFLVV